MSEKTPVTEKVLGGTEKTPVAIHQVPQKDYSKVMKAVVWHGKESLKVDTVPRPRITDPGDAIIRVQASTICGSDLHLYHNAIPEMKKGDILGHEAMGVVEEVGPDVKDIKKGDRVAVSCVIACGSCEFCQRQQFSCCDRTNPSKTMEKMFGGHRIAGFFGYSHITGGYPGGQAEYLRVPFADVNLLKLPNEISDEEAVLLSDVACTGWHCCELGEVTEGKTVACWGLGPIGLMALVWARHRKAARCIGIDCIPERLETAKRLGIEVINYKQDDPVKTLLKMLPNGPDCTLECVGFRYAKSWKHTFEKALMLETDSIDSLTECIYAVKKGGNVSIIGDFIGFANHFPIGPVMEKGLTLRGGQVFVQKYWKDLCSKIANKEVDVSWLITHRMSLDEAPEAYRIFDKKENGVLKIILKPSHSGYPS